MKIINFKCVFLLLYFFSSGLLAETITIINTPPTIDGVVGTPTENVVTKAIGESLRVIVKPKENLIGIVNINGEIVAEGEVNRVLRYRHTVEANATIEVSYEAGVEEINFIDIGMVDSLGNEINISLPDTYTESDVIITEGVTVGEHPETYQFLTDDWIEVTLPPEQSDRQQLKVQPNGEFNSVMQADEAEDEIILTPFTVDNDTGEVEFKMSPIDGKITFSLIQINE